MMICLWSFLLSPVSHAIEANSDELTRWRQLQYLTERDGYSARFRSSDCAEPLKFTSPDRLFNLFKPRLASWDSFTRGQVAALLTISDYLFKASQVALQRASPDAIEQVLLPDPSIFLKPEELVKLSYRLKQLSKVKRKSLNDFAPELARVGVQLSPLVTFSDLLSHDLEDQSGQFFSLVVDVCATYSREPLWAEVCSVMSAQLGQLLVTQVPKGGDLAIYIDRARSAIDQAAKMDRLANGEFVYMEPALLTFVHMIRLYGETPVLNRSRASINVHRYYTYVLQYLNAYVMNFENHKAGIERYSLFVRILEQALHEPAIREFPLIERDLKHLSAEWKRIKPH